MILRAVAVFAFCLMLVPPAIIAQDDAASVITPEREAAAMTFAKLHHPELSSLLLQLKEMDQSKYEAAVRDLFRTSERLARYQDRTPERYQTELEMWKIDSRVRLLVARSVSGMEDETREQVKKLLMKRNRIRSQQLESERKRLQARLHRLGDQISELKSDSETLAENELDRLMKSVRNRPKTRQAATRTPRSAESVNATKTKSQPVKKRPEN